MWGAGFGCNSWRWRLSHTTRKAGFGACKPVSGTLWNVERSCKTAVQEYRNTWHCICKSFFAPFSQYCREKMLLIQNTIIEEGRDVCVREKERDRERGRSFKRPSKSDKKSPSKNKRKEAFWYTFAISRCTPCFFHVTPISAELVNHTHHFGALKGQFLPTFLSSCQAQLKLVERKLDGALSFEQNPLLVHWCHLYPVLSYSG